MLRAAVAEYEAKVLPAIDKKFQAERDEWEGKRGGSGYVKRVDDERARMMSARLDLRDLADVIDLTAARQLSDNQVARLVHIYVFDGWPAQRQAIAKALKAAGPRAARAIEKQAQVVQPVFVGADQAADKLMGDTAKGASRQIPYDYYRNLAATIRQGLAELKKL